MTPALFLAGILTLAANTTYSQEQSPYIQFRVSEFVFEAAAAHKNPFQVQTNATFAGPDGQKLKIPAFWDGDRRWKVRFSPTAPGKWTYTTESTPKDPGLDGQSGTCESQAAQGRNPLFRHGGFLKVSSSGHYLTYTDDTPFFWLGDTWWFCPSNLMPFETCFKKCLDTRSQQGYTVIQMCFLKAHSADGDKGSFSDFAKTGTIDPNYWQQADRYIRYANASGIIPVFGLTFSSGMEELTLAQWQQLWRYVIARYGAYAVSFLICGEYNQAQVGDVNERVPKTLALGRFIKDTDPYKRAISVHPWWYGGDQHQVWSQSWYDFVMLQGAHGTLPPTTLYSDIYNDKMNRPVLESECRYEGIHSFDAASVREVAYRAVQSGSFGYTYGAHGLWYPTQDANDTTFKEWGTPVVWSTALAKPGGAQMQHLRACYESVKWWLLEPRPQAVTTDKPLKDEQTILTKAFQDDEFIIYFSAGIDPNTTAFLHSVKTGTNYSAEWFDPRTGQKEKLQKPLVSAEDKLLLPTRKTPDDWLLILRKNPL